MEFLLFVCIFAYLILMYPTKIEMIRYMQIQQSIYWLSTVFMFEYLEIVSDICNKPKVLRL